MAIGLTQTVEIAKQQKADQLSEFFASLTSSQAASLEEQGTKATFIQFKEFQDTVFAKEAEKVQSAVGITSRCAIVNDSDGILQGVYPQNVPINEFNHPPETTVVGIASTYFSGSGCNVHAGWKYTTESGFFNPNLPTNSDLFKTLRETRDLFLTQSDWTRMDDNQLSSDKKTEWATYRQALRDLPANTADPSNPTWPTKPN